jgi:hypothetical protein
MSWCGAGVRVRVCCACGIERIYLCVSHLTSRQMPARLLLPSVALILALPACNGFQARTPSVRMQTQGSSPSYQPTDGSSAPSEPADFCRMLQDGAEEVDGLFDLLASSKGARAFFNAYLCDDEWTCADTSDIPEGLVAAIQYAPPPTFEALLMNVITSAASSKESDGRKGERARILINGLWEKAMPLRLSCVALQDALEPEETVIVDARSGDLELIRQQWRSLLEFTSYGEEQLGRIRDALTLCGGSSGIVRSSADD